MWLHDCAPKLCPPYAPGWHINWIGCLHLAQWLRSCWSSSGGSGQRGGENPLYGSHSPMYSEDAINLIGHSKGKKLKKEHNLKHWYFLSPTSLYSSVTTELGGVVRLFWFTVVKYNVYVSLMSSFHSAFIHLWNLIVSYFITIEQLDVLMGRSIAVFCHFSMWSGFMSPFLCKQ